MRGHGGDCQSQAKLNGVSEKGSYQGPAGRASGSRPAELPPQPLSLAPLAGDGPAGAERLDKSRTSKKMSGGQAEFFDSPAIPAAFASPAGRFQACCRPFPLFRSQEMPDEGFGALRRVLARAAVRARFSAA